MSNRDDAPIKITLEELADTGPPQRDPHKPAAAETAGKNYGNIGTAADPVPETDSKSRASWLLHAWVYLGVAGLAGAFAAWAICEPAFVDGGGIGRGWGNFWLLPLTVALLCIGFGMAESIVERSLKKGAYRTALAIPLGLVFGFVFDFGANLVYRIGLNISTNSGATDYHSPLFWIARAVGWAVLGIAGGLVYGIIGQSMKKAQYGVLGGVLGAAVGGMLFDPIALALGGAAVSRMVGLTILGGATGAAMGVVESALKHKWLYVSSGPLAGKQFILYRPNTTIGSSQQCDIFLFKDASILPTHATIEQRGSRLQIVANGPVYVSAQPVRGPRVLDDGDLIQIGRYGFRYREKAKQ